MRSAKALLGLVLTIALATTSLAQQPSAMKEVGLVRTGQGAFSIDVEGADVRTVLRAIAEFSGRNIVVAPTVKGEVRVSLHEVGWLEAMRTILRSNGLDYVEEGSIIRVDDASKLHAEGVERESARAKQLELVPLETRLIRLNYANATELSTALTASLSRRGAIQTDKRTNSLIITDLGSTLDAIERMAIELDSTTPQIEITAKLVDVDAEALRAVGIEWNVGQPSNYFDGPISGTAHVPNPGPGQLVGAEHDTPIGDPATRIAYGIFRDWGSVEAQLQLLEQNRKANIISNPRVVTVDNREAKIVVGQKIPLIVQDIAGNAVSQLQTIGIQLKCTPHLTDDKKIILDLHPEVSDLSTQSTVQGGVIINTSEADTRVMVEDGQTAVIGGLIRTNDSKVRKGVPILKDFPLIGFLFRSENVVRQNRELLIFVTPRLMPTLASK
ncbi:MAG TPA: type IV pilus secretin PilQ [Candidatus Eisenbacteria bacterium]|nr:type IV pilus secretin PilQ [Candidatus Eisenbacteria bacterium]